MDNAEKDVLPPVEVPLTAISAETLDNIIESFIQREGTDYGANEISLETKVKQIHAQLRRGDIKLVFNPNNESVTIVTNNQWKKLTII